jgi:acylphosphatase
MAAASHERRRVRYTGRVQGVGFRFTTHSIAQRYAVAGYVKNLSDRSVELVAEGATGELDRFLAEVAERMADYIREATALTEPATGEYSRFEVAH